MVSHKPRISDRQVARWDRALGRVAGYARFKRRVPAFISFAAIILSLGLSQCSIQLPCASGDPTCSPEGLLALFGDNRPAAFVVGTNQGQIAYSSNPGDGWRVISLGSNYLITSLALVDGRVFALGDDGSGNGFFFSSSDLEQWDGPTIISGEPIIHADSDGSQIYAVGTSSSFYRILVDGSFNNLGNADTTPGNITMLEYQDGVWFLSDSSGPPDPFFTLSPSPLPFSVPSISAPTDPTTDLLRVGSEWMAVGTVQTFVTNAGSLDDWSVYNSGTTEIAICGDGIYGAAATDTGDVKITVNGQTLGAPQSTGVGANPPDIGCNSFFIVILPAAATDWKYSADGGLSWPTIPNPVGSGIPQVIEYFP